MKESDFSILKQLMHGVNYTDNASGTPKTHQITGGGAAGPVTSIPVTFISKKRKATATLYYIYCLYNAFLDSDFTQVFQKGKVTMMKAKMVGLNVPTRAEKDQIYQIVEQYES